MGLDETRPPWNSISWDGISWDGAMSTWDGTSHLGPMVSLHQNLLVVEGGYPWQQISRKVETEGCELSRKKNLCNNYKVTMIKQMDSAFRE